MISKIAAVLSVAVVGSVGGQVQPGWLGGTIAEGYTGPARDTPITVAYRMFTAPVPVCTPGAPPPVRLEAQSGAIALQVGDRFSLSTMTVRAFDATGTFLPKAPISVLVYYEPGALRFADDKTPEFSASAPGRAIVIFNALCVDETYANLELPITIVANPTSR
jgi:hypothetical protein